MTAVRIAVNGAEDSDDEEIDRWTGALYGDLATLDIHSIDRVGAEAPAGAKAGIADVVGVLVATGVLSATTVKAIADVVSAFVQRSAARSVSMELGDHRIEITGAGRAEVEAVVRLWCEAGGEDPDP
ncbi:hypothetical protein [Saccharomonospora iraqiensis]|uniref:hypothetical protein n=1 Tax=Saccharomonospora iraqiensis TaxID=52698 RepID=UPI0012FBDF7F|nr:hypothetical protein [Saccharomonospora iraqiensis]